MTSAPTPTTAVSYLIKVTALAPARYYSIMASIVFNTLLVAVCLYICLVSGSPSKKDSFGGSAKKATSTTTKAPKSKCDMACTDEYTPICANEKGSTEKPKSFGNICVMNKYNCEHNTNLQEESKGECKDGSGVRLA